MKNLIYLGIMSGIMALGLLSCSGCTSESVGIGILTEEEKADLLFLREEEKLARDVYLYAYDKYGINIFNNISNSEQRHMDKVLGLLTAYQIADPTSTERGIFNNQELQDLYNALTTQVDISQKEALMVGATIEDLDINDIQDFKDRTTKADILAVYNNLECGSRNHIRAFTSQLSAIGETYVPQYISQENLEAILNAAKERCGQ